MGQGPWIGGRDHQLLCGVGCTGQTVPVEGEVADERVSQPLGAHPYAGHLATCPPLPEVGVGHRELADEGGQPGVARAPGSLQTQVGDAGPSVRPPVEVELPEGGVGEEQPGVVAFLLGDPVEVGEQGGSQRVPGEDVQVLTSTSAGVAVSSSRMRLSCGWTFCAGFYDAVRTPRSRPARTSGHAGRRRGAGHGPER